MTKIKLAIILLFLGATAVATAQTPAFTLDRSIPIITAVDGGDIVVKFGPVKLSFTKDWRFVMDRGVSVGHGPGEGVVFVTVARASESTLKEGVLSPVRIATEKAAQVAEGKKHCGTSPSSRFEELVATDDKRIFVAWCQNTFTGVGPVYGIHYAILSKSGIVRLSGSGRGFGRQMFDKVALSHKW